MDRFGTRLRDARHARGWSLGDLEARTGIQKPRLSRYENGWVIPTIDSVEVLAKALRVAPAVLVGWQR